MSRFFITFFTVFFIHHHQVSSFWLVKFPIIMDEVTEYADNIQRIIEKDSCLLSNDGVSLGNEYTIGTTVNQIQTAIEQLTVTSNIQENIKKSLEYNKHDDSERFFRRTGPIYRNYQQVLTSFTQQSGQNLDLLADNIYNRINIRNDELECLRLRFIRYQNEPDKSIFHHIISIYSAMDRTSWCDKHDFSWHLSFFNFYYDMIINEFRIFLMDVADYVILLCHAQSNVAGSVGTDGQVSVSQSLTADSVRITLSQKKENLLSNVKQYLSALKWANTVSRKNLYQCSPKELRKGETYIEFANSIISESPSLETCDENSNSGIYGWRHEHFGDFNSDPNDPCPKQVLHKVNHPTVAIHLNSYMNEMCVRACSQEDPNTDRLQTISLLEQTSDIAENMVVTNVRFVEANGMIQIQIEQGQLDGSNTYMIKDRYWKPLSKFKKLYNPADNTIQFYTPGSSDFERNFLTQGTSYVNIDSNQKTLHLDDVMLPSGYVVTGIRFGYNQNSLDELKPLELQIQGTLYDVEKNELITFLDGKSTSMWITPNVMSPSLPDYQRTRTQYGINGAGYPFEANGILNSEPNQYVDFTRSQWLIRYKYRTVPLFDARPTFSEVSLPLGGISLFIKGDKGPQSFITLNTFPYPVSQIWNSKI